MCKVCERKAIAAGEAIELYHEGVDINGDVTLELEYHVPAPTRPVQPVHRVEGPVSAPDVRYVTQKPCQTCPAVLRLRDFAIGGDRGFESAARRFRWATHCGRCMGVWLKLCEQGTALASIDEMTAEHVTAWEAAKEKR